VSNKKNREDLKFQLEDQLQDIKIATVDCLVCGKEIDVNAQPHGWLHMECEKVRNPELFLEEETTTDTA
jgi:hypothetical protein